MAHIARKSATRTIRPQARIFWDSRASWSCGGDDLPVYSEYVTS